MARGILKRAFRGIPPRGIPAILRGVYHLDFGARGTWRGGYTTYFRARGVRGAPLGGGYMKRRGVHGAPLGGGYMKGGVYAAGGVREVFRIAPCQASPPGTVPVPPSRGRHWRGSGSTHR